MLLGRNPAGPQTPAASPSVLRGLDCCRHIWDSSGGHFYPECQVSPCFPETLQFIKEPLNVSDYSVAYEAPSPYYVPNPASDAGVSEMSMM